MGWIKRAWRGEEKLWKVFWIGLLLPQIISMCIGMYKGFMLGFEAAHQHVPISYVPFSTQPWWLCTVIAWYIFIEILVTKCGSNTRRNFWKYIAHIMMVVAIVFAILAAIGVLTRGSQLGFTIAPNASVPPSLSNKTDVPSAVSIPPMPTAVAPTEQAYYMSSCQKAMADYAQNNGADPQQYIAKNQAYLQQCVQYNITKNTPTNTTISENLNGSLEDNRLQVSPLETAPKPVQNGTTLENLNDGFASPARSWDKAETQRQITGQTFLRNYPGKQNEILYFGSDNIVYQWVSGSPFILSSTWVSDFLSSRSGQSARLYICTSLKNPATTHPGVNDSRRCIEPAMLFIPATDHREGDVFSIAGKTTAPSILTIERTTIENIKKQLVPTQ